MIKLYLWAADSLHLGVYTEIFEQKHFIFSLDNFILGEQDQVIFIVWLIQ